MKRVKIAGFAGILTLAGACCLGQKPVHPPLDTAAPAPIERRDPALDAASNLIGKALFLRCFCSENNLSFDAQGQLAGQVKPTDWTLAAVNVLKAERKSPTEIELEGVRVAIRFDTGRREFDRHPLNDDKMKIQLADPANPTDPTAFARELSSIFSEGLDRRLQLAMPIYWQHYFDPHMAWPPDDLSSVPIYVAGTATHIPGATPGGEGFVPVSATKKASAAYTPQASRDRVQGTVDLRIAVDGDGIMRRIVVEQPIGYGLDARAVEALSKWKFSPAKLAGRPVAAYALIRPEFTVVDIPR